MVLPKLVKIERTRLSPWVEIVSKTVRSATDQVYHSLAQQDYLSVLALTPERNVLLVRQYRPAMEGPTLELPGGLRDSDEDVRLGIARELFEETAHRAVSEVKLLGVFAPDTGRLENRMHGFVVDRAERDVSATVEPGLEMLEVGAHELRTLIGSGEFNHALHIAIITLAALGGHFPELLETYGV
jgi:ADP-ribose pyrophosphatase